MKIVRRYRHPLAVLAMVLVVDLVVRIGSGFDMAVVVTSEAILFAVAAILLWRAAGRAGAADASLRRLDLWLAACFALAGIRAALWAVGLAVYTANLVILGLAVATGVVAWARARRRRD